MKYGFVRDWFDVFDSIGHKPIWNVSKSDLPRARFAMSQANYRNEIEKPVGDRAIAT